MHGAVPGDFNGDGDRDAVLPAPGANVSGKEAAGAVVVLYGSASGLSATSRKTITQNTRPDRRCGLLSAACSGNSTCR